MPKSPEQPSPGEQDASKSEIEGRPERFRYKIIIEFEVVSPKYGPYWQPHHPAHDSFGDYESAARYLIAEGFTSLGNDRWEGYDAGTRQVGRAVIRKEAIE